MRRKNYMYTIFITGGLLAAVISASATGLFTNLWNSFFKEQPDINMLLIQPFPSPNSKGKIQILILSNTGTCSAKGLIVQVKYPRIIQPIDYKIESIEEATETRTDDTLKVKFRRLTCGDSILIIFAVNHNEITPEKIKIVCNVGKINRTKIKYITFDKLEAFKND